MNCNRGTTVVTGTYAFFFQKCDPFCLQVSDTSLSFTYKNFEGVMYTPLNLRILIASKSRRGYSISVNSKQPGVPKSYCCPNN